MTRKAKRSSAVNIDSSDLLGSVVGRRALAIRGSSSDADRSGAPSASSEQGSVRSRARTAFTLLCLASLGAVASMGGASTVAPALAAEACPNESLRAEQSVGSLPDCRAYEMVSPADISLGIPDGSIQPGALTAWNGEAVSFCTDAVFGDEPNMNGSVCDNNLVQRGAAGWRLKGLYPPFCPADFGETVLNAQIAFSRPVGFSPNLDLEAFIRPESSSCTAHPALDPAAPQPALNLYRKNLAGASPEYALLASKPAAVLKYSTLTASFAGASADFSHVVYTSTGNQTNPPDSPAPGSFNKVYDWHNGSPTLVSKSTGGVPLTTASSVPKVPIHGVSADGNRIFFQNPTSGASEELYLRENATTYWVSEQECSPACSDTSAADVFEWATPDGSKAFLLSAAKLVNSDTSAAGNDLYMFTKGPNPAGEAENLTLLSKDNEPADGTEAAVLGMLGLSDNGNTVYFAASKQIVAGAPTAAGAKLYRWHWNGGVGTTEYIGLINMTSGPPPGGDAQNWAGIDASGGEATGQPVLRLVTPDGRDLLVETTKALVPGVDTDSTRDLYRWDEEEVWTCLSCQQPGQPSAGEATFDARKDWAPLSNPLARLNSAASETAQRIAMSDDGQRAFFASPDALVPEDTNGLFDIYEWVALGGGECSAESSSYRSWDAGCIYLISSGTGSGPSTLISASHLGHDVFFLTIQSLVGGDGNGRTNIYDARVGGGFAEPAPAAAPCEGEACRGAGTSAPAAASAASAAFQGSGNPTPERKCKRGLVKRRGGCVKPRHKHRKRAANNNREVSR
jgi:hypothetical protein